MNNLKLEWIAEINVEQACRGGCGRRVDGPFLCDSCWAKQMAHRAKPTWDAIRERVPRRFHWARFDSELLSERIARPDAIHEARSAIGASALLTGPSHAGKSSLAAAMFHELLDLGEHAKSSDHPDVLRALGLRWFTALSLCAARKSRAYGTGEAQEIELAIGSSLLVLDDLGQESDPATCSEVIFTRCDAKRLTIVTTGLSKTGLVAKYGAGIAERLCHMTLIRAGLKI